MAVIAASNAARAGNSLLVVTTVDDLAVMTGGAACATLGDSFANTGQEIAVLVNSSVAPINVTFVTESTVDGRAVGNRVVAIPAGALVAVGPFNIGDYSLVSGYVNMTYATEVGLTIQVLKVTPA